MITTFYSAGRYHADDRRKNRSPHHQRERKPGGSERPVPTWKGSGSGQHRTEAQTSRPGSVTDGPLNTCSPWGPSPPQPAPTCPNPPQPAPTRLNLPQAWRQENPTTLKILLPVWTERLFLENVSTQQLTNCRDDSRRPLGVPSPGLAHSQAVGGGSERWVCGRAGPGLAGRPRENV